MSNRHGLRGKVVKSKSMKYKYYKALMFQRASCEEIGNNMIMIIV